MAYKYSYGDEKEVNLPKLPTNRNFLKFWILNVLTFGIYSIFFFIPFAFDLDTVSPKRDGTKTFNYFAAYILAGITGSIVYWIWFYMLTERIEDAIAERHINYDFTLGDFWKWLFCGTLIFAVPFLFFLNAPVDNYIWLPFLILMSVGPIVYHCKLCKAMNLLCAAYNEKNEAK